MVRKFALVTGASSGIGRAVALGLLEVGYHVALAARNKPALLDVIKNAGDDVGRRAHAISCDIGDQVSVKKLFSEIESVWGRLDLLFNNAGVFTPQSSIEDIVYADWKKAVDVNLGGAFLCTQEAFRLMKNKLRKVVASSIMVQFLLTHHARRQLLIPPQNMPSRA